MAVLHFQIYCFRLGSTSSQKMARAQAAVLAMLSLPANRENGGFAKYLADLANRIFQTRKVLGSMSNLDVNFEAEVKKLRGLRQSGVPTLILHTYAFRSGCSALS